MGKTEVEYVWKDRKHTFLGLPLSFTRYRLTETKLILDTGFLNRTIDEVRLYRIMDLTLKRSLGERLFGLGTIHCHAGDKTTPEFDIRHIRHSQDVMNMLSDMVEGEREAKRVGVREMMHTVDVDDELDDGPDDDNDDEWR